MRETKNIKANKKYIKIIYTSLIINIILKNTHKWNINLVILIKLINLIIIICIYLNLNFYFQVFCFPDNFV